MFDIWKAERPILSSVVLCALFTTGFMLIYVIVPVGTSRTGCDQIAYSSNQSGNWEIYLLDISSGLTVNLTRSDANEDYPFWSPDGHQLAYTVTYPDTYHREIAVHTINTGNIHRYNDRSSPFDDPPPHFSSDGQSLVMGGAQTPIRWIDLETGETSTLPMTTPQTFTQSSNLQNELVNQPGFYFVLEQEIRHLRLYIGDNHYEVASHERAPISAPHLSSDSRCVAYLVGPTGDRSVYMVDLMTNQPELLLDGNGDYSFAVWRTQ